MFTKKLKVKKVVSMLLSVAMILSMLVTATFTVSAEEYWNEAGLKLQELMQEYADDPEIMELLELFRAEYIDELVGYNPNIWTEDNTPTIEKSLPMVDFTPMLSTNIFANPFGVTPFSTPELNDGTFWFRVAGQQNQDVIITRLVNPSLHTGALIIPPTILGRTVKRIGTNAFRNTSITSVTIPATVDRIDQGAFENCTRLQTVTFLGQTPPVLDSLPWNIYPVFRNSNAINRVNVPFGAIARYWNNVPELRRFNVICQSCSRRPCRCQWRLGDVDGDWTIQTRDAIQIIRYTTGLDSTIRCERGIYNVNALNAALITEDSIHNNHPGVRDSIQIIRFVTYLDTDYILG